MYYINLVDRYRNILPIFKEKKQSNLDLFTTSFDSEDEMIKTLGLNPKDFNVEILDLDKNKSEELPFLTKKYRNVLSLESSGIDSFLEDLSKCDRKSLYDYYICELLNRFMDANDDYNLFRKEKLDSIIDAFQDDDDYMELHDKEKYTNDQIMKIIKPYYFDKFGKPVYSQFKHTFYHFVSNGEIQSDYKFGEKDEYERDKIVRDIKPLVEKNLDMSRGYFEEGKLKKKEFDTIEYDEIEDEIYQIHSRNKDRDIDDEETELDIFMDEKGLSDDEKRITREENRKKRYKL